jgi:glyoxylase I family protein
MTFMVEHLGLAARDPVTLKEWYVNSLGAREIFTDNKTPPAFLLELGDGSMIEIYPADLARAGAVHNKLEGWRHLAVRVGSIETARDELTGRGVIFEDTIKPAGGGGRVLFFKDVEGNLLHLVERPEGSIPARGRVDPPAP